MTKPKRVKVKAVNRVKDLWSGSTEGRARKCEQTKGYCRVPRQQAFSVPTCLAVAVAKSGHTVGLMGKNGRAALTAEGPHSRYQVRPAPPNITIALDPKP